MSWLFIFIIGGTSLIIVSTGIYILFTTKNIEDSPQKKKKHAKKPLETVIALPKQQTTTYPPLTPKKHYPDFAQHFTKFYECTTIPKKK